VVGASLGVLFSAPPRASDGAVIQARVRGSRGESPWEISDSGPERVCTAGLSRRWWAVTA